MSEGIHYDYFKVNREDEEEEKEEEEEEEEVEEEEETINICSKSAETLVCCFLRYGLLWHQTTLLVSKVLWVYESSEVRILFRRNGAKGYVEGSSVI